MPLYEYECSTCHRRTEKIQKFSDPEITVCPHCTGPLERVLSAPAIAFKGGGWYADGYGNAKPKSNSTGDGANTTTSSSDTTSSGDAKSSSSDSKSGNGASTSNGSTPAAAPAAAPATASSSSDKK